MSVRRRPSFSISSPYRLACSGSSTTPADRFCAADLMTASGVRSSCETVATNSICCAASFSDLRALITIRPTPAINTPRMPKLVVRFRRRACATASSSDPAPCCRMMRHPGNETRSGNPSAMVAPAAERSCTNTERLPAVAAVRSAGALICHVCNRPSVMIRVLTSCRTPVKNNAIASMCTWSIVSDGASPRPNTRSLSRFTTATR